MTQNQSHWKAPASSYANIVELLDNQAERFGETEYCTFPDGQRTYASLANRSQRLASGFANAGVDPGDRVAMIMYNRPAFLDVYFAVARLGAVLVPINVSLRGKDLEHTLTNATPEAVILGPNCAERYKDVRSDVSIDHEITVESTDTYANLDDFYCSYDKASTPSMTQADPLVMIYTSGTTGMPKGVVLPHGALLTVATELSEQVIKPREDDRLYMSQPLFHIFAQMVMVEALVAGVPFSMEKWFSKSKFWDRVKNHKATIIHFSSAISDILYEGTDSSDNPVRVAFGAIHEDIQEPFGEKFNCQVIPLYGLTESGGLALCGTVDNPQAGSLGTPTSYADVEIVDENDEKVPTGENGEIVIRPTQPNSMFTHYYDKPHRTVEVLRNQWLHTGDIGYRTADGQFHFVDRKSYFLRRKGENVSVHEVERVLSEHDDVDEAVVVGVNADIGGEEVFAAIKPNTGVSIEPLSLIQFCEQRLAYFKIPRFIASVAEFPRTETKGTIERHKMLDRIDDAWDLNNVDYKLKR